MTKQPLDHDGRPLKVGQRVLVLPFDDDRDGIWWLSAGAHRLDKYVGHTYVINELELDDSPSFKDWTAVLDDGRESRVWLACRWFRACDTQVLRTYVERLRGLRV